MRRILLGLLVLSAALLFVLPADAGHGRWHRHGWGHHHHHHHGWGHHHHGWGHHHHGWGHHHHGWGHHHHGWGHRWGGYWPSFGWGGGWGGYYGGTSLSISLGYPAYYGDYVDPWCNYGGYRTFAYGVYPGYGVLYNPRYNSLNYLVDSSYEPAELAFGPLAVKQFLGLDRNFALGELRRPAKVIDAATVRAKVRVSNAESRRRADDYIAQGDTLFREQKFNSAVQKYKLAAQWAPDVAECYWRLGHGLIAVSQHDQAATAFRRAMLMNDDLVRGGFKLDDLYDGAEPVKNAHFEALAAKALDAAVDGDPFFLIGIMLHYDGEPERAHKFFARAAELTAPENQQYVTAFLAPKVDLKGGAGLPVRAVVPAADEMEI